MLSSFCGAGKILTKERAKKEMARKARIERWQKIWRVVFFWKNQEEQSHNIVKKEEDCWPDLSQKNRLEYTIW